MAVADMVDAVAVEIHVAASGGVLDPDAFGLGNRRDTRAGKALVEKGRRVAAQQFLRRRVALPGAPFLAGYGFVGFAFGMDERHWPNNSSMVSSPSPKPVLAPVPLVTMTSRASVCGASRRTAFFVDA